MPDVQNMSIRLVPQVARPSRLVVSGPLEMVTALDLEDALFWELTERRQALVDLSEVSFMDSCGMRVLVWAMNLAKLNGWSFHIRDELPDHVRKTFRITGLDSLLPLVAA